MLNAQLTVHQYASILTRHDSYPAILPVPQTEAEVPGRPVYLLSNITWGAFRDVQARINKYWYWGGLKERMAYVFAVFKGEYQFCLSFLGAGVIYQAFAFS